MAEFSRQSLQTLWLHSSRFLVLSVAALALVVLGALTTDVFVLRRAREASTTPAPAPAPVQWVSQIGAHQRRNFSQGAQDGILEYIFEHVGARNRFFVEFGYGYGNVSYKNRKTNTYYLFAHKRWRGVLFDTLLEDKSINLYRATLTPGTIVEVFERHKVPHEVDYVSIDVDSIDLWLLEALLAPKSPYRPRVLTVEHNPNLPSASLISFQPEWSPWRKDIAYGASVGAIWRVARDAGYQVVYKMPTLDVFLVRDDLVRGQNVPRLAAWPNACRRVHAPASEASMARMLDVGVWKATGNRSLAQRHAREQVAARARKCGMKFVVDKR